MEEESLNNIRKENHKQRGFYSELLAPEVSREVAKTIKKGVNDASIIKISKKQRVPRAYNPNMTSHISATFRKRSRVLDRSFHSKSSKSGKKSLMMQSMLGNKTMNQSRFVYGDIKMPASTYGYYSKQEDGVADVEPKVMEPYIPIPGRVPRKVELDRKKKEFTSFDLERLLEERGVYKNDEPEYLRWLPLFLFDDETYDDYSPEEWLEKAKQTENQLALRAQGLSEENGRYVWRSVLINDFDDDSKEFKGKFSGGGREQCQFKRIDLWFETEDPRKFAERVRIAHRNRKITDSKVRYRFYIDNMPKTDVNAMDPEQKNRLISNAKNTRMLKNSSKNGNEKQEDLKSQASQEYERTMNKIIFDEYIDEANPDLMPVTLDIPPEEEKEAPEFGLIRIPTRDKEIISEEFSFVKPSSGDFSEIFRKFCFSSLFIKEEVILALQGVKEKCKEVSKENLFKIDYPGGDRIDAFRNAHGGNISRLGTLLKDNWINDMTRIIKTNFNNVGKGWFNMKETNRLTYEFGKLKRFLTVIRLNMQDTLFTLIQRGLFDFRDYLESFIPQKVDILGENRVVNSYGNIDEKFKQNKGKCLMRIDMVRVPNAIEFGYSIKPQKIVHEILDLVSKALKELEKIPDLEPKILEKLHKAKNNTSFVMTPILPKSEPEDPDPNETPKRYPDENKWVWETNEDFRRIMKKAVKPLEDFTQAFKHYKPLLENDADEYIRKLEGNDDFKDAYMLKQEVIKFTEAEKKLKSAIPEEIQVSCFLVDCKELIRILSGKYQDLIKRLIELMARRARDATAQVGQKLVDIEKMIRLNPETIEELCEIREFIDNQLNIQMNKVKIQTEKAIEIYDILEEYNFKVSREDLDRKWNAFGGPNEIEELVKMRQKDFNKMNEKFDIKMNKEQEQFADNIKQKAQIVKTLYSRNKIEDCQNIAEDMKLFKDQLEDMSDMARLYNNREQLFKKPTMTDYSEIDELKRGLKPYYDLWTNIHTWVMNKGKWLKDSWHKVDAFSAEKFVEDGLKKIASCIRVFENRAEENPGFNSLVSLSKDVKSEVDEFKPKVPLLVCLKREGMNDRHWKDVSKAIGKEINPKNHGKDKPIKQKFNFNYVLKEGLLDHLPDCLEIGERAYREHSIEMMLNSMKEVWKTVEFTLIPYKKTYIIASFEEVEEILDKHMGNTQNLLINPYKDHYQKEIDEWNNKMLLVSYILEEWAKFQKKWKYLAPIFESSDISKDLPNESNLFKRVDVNWRHAMGQTYVQKNLLKICEGEGYREKFKEWNNTLEKIQKELNDYLEKKRNIFGRFYFLSDDDLLSILSQTKEVERIQGHLTKVFENIERLDFDAQKKILAMNSSEKEKVQFIKIIDPNHIQVERWMSEVEDMMKKSVRYELEDAWLKYDKKKRNQWILNHPGQCVLNASQIHWTQEVEEMIQAREEFPEVYDEYVEFLENQLEALISIDRDYLSSNQFKTVQALIVIDVHALKIVKDALKNCTNLEDFEWISQLRYYWTDNKDGKKRNDCYVECVQTCFPYGYEYLGNSTRLVITPLTDKCYMTLMGALKLNLGGAPAGPAGTGKTESTKDLAKALAKQCNVFNCQESMDTTFVAKFFKGLASCGAWCCFDEFNRINLEVLSVIAQQLQELFDAKSKGDSSIRFEGSMIKFNKTFSVYVTMNPGYAGRNELPDNLKALFRYVAMMVPDYSLIAEIMLFSFGYPRKTGSELAKKIHDTFTLSSEQLSSQSHYDYGLRAVITVVKAAGRLKRYNKRGLDDFQLVLKALNDVNLPKFLKDDLPLFSNIIKDLFPDTKLPEQDYGDLTPAIKRTCKILNYEPVEVFRNKIYQLYDTLNVRHGLMLVGPTGGGKSATIKTLQASISLIAKGNPEHEFTKVNTKIINPKALTMAQLYGEYRDMTWQEGISERIFGEAANNQYDAEKGKEKFWIVFDGPVDSKWIESMNTVLDDNKKLCLSSGKMLKISNYMSLIFETENLAEASPATVSRCGMIYMEPVALGVKPLFNSFYRTIPGTLRSKGSMLPRLKKMIDAIYPDIFEAVRTKCKEPQNSMDSNLANSFFKLINCWFDEFIEQEGVKINTQKIQKVNTGLENLALFCMTWSFCSTVDANGRKILNEIMRSKIGAFSSINIPEEGLIYDYDYNLEENTWIHWSEYSKSFMIKPKDTYGEIVVPTKEFTRIQHIQLILLQNKRNILCPGPTGTGKSIGAIKILSDSLGQPDKFTGLSIVLSAQTSAKQLQDTVFSQTTRIKKHVYGPPDGKKLICFVDDLNMPKPGEYGAQPPIELLRQYLDHSAWYVIQEDKDYIKINDIILLGAMGPSGEGRAGITSRIVRHFNIIAYTEMSNEIIKSIFDKILNHFLGNFDEKVSGLIPKLIDTALEIFNRVKKQLKPIPSKSHYLFNLRDISKVFQGVSNASKDHTYEPVHLARIWYHENMRVYHDRFTTQEDRDYFVAQLESLFGEFGVTENEFYGEEKTRIIFCDFIKSLGGGGLNPKYVQVEDMAKMVYELESIQFNHDDLAKSRDKLDLVLFEDACEHICRIARILSQPQGHALLLGVGGSGRQSLTRLAVFIRNMELKRIEVVKGYNTSKWREDIKRIIMDAIENDSPMCFLVVDTQIVNEMMVEDINSLINSGMIVGLPFSQEEEEKMEDIATKICLDNRKAPNKINIYQSQVDRVKRNTHVCFAMSPLAEITRTRLRMFPSFINCCTTDWFTEWPEEALVRVGHKEIEDYAEALQIDSIADEIVQMFKYMHKSVEEATEHYRRELRRHNYITPTSYLELIKLFRKIIEEKNRDNKRKTERLKNGIKQLMNAEREVKILNERLIEEEPKMLEAQKNVDQFIEKLEIDEAAAKKTEIEVGKENEKAKIAKNSALELQGKIQAEVKDINAELDKVFSKIDKLDPKAFGELRKYSAPKPSLKALGIGVCYLLIDKIKSIKYKKSSSTEDIDNYFWERTKNELFNKPQAFLTKAKTIDKDKIEEVRIKNIKKLLYNHPERKKNFNYLAISNASSAGGDVFYLIDAMVKYYDINEATKPKREELARINAEVQEKERIVAKKGKELREVKKKIDDLNKNLKLKRDELKKLEDDIMENKLKLERANKLTSLLGNEKTRWKDDIERFEKEKKLIPGNSVMSAGMVAYSGPFTSDFRESIEKKFVEKLVELNIPHQEGIRMRKFLENPVDVQTWNIKGLPKDETSKENGIIMYSSSRWPLMIDPQTQALKFIKKMGKDEHSEGFISINASSPDVMKMIEQAIQTGKWILLENISTNIDPALEPILLRQYTQDRGGRGKMITLGEKKVAYHDSFMLYMTSTNPNPHYSPETCAKVTIINFGITRKGLEEQMLATIVILENKKLEDKKNNIVSANARNRKDLKVLEDRILNSLEENQETILDEDTIIDQLASSKRKSTEIQQSVEESKKTEAEIDQAREDYRKLAYHTSILFFCIIDLSSIDTMYQYSLQWFISLFKMGVESTPTSNDINLRLENLTNYFTELLYRNVCRSLFGRHKLLFSFLMTTRLMEGEGKLDKDAYRYLMMGPTGEIEIPENPTKKDGSRETWIAETSWAEIYKQLHGLNKVPKFSGILENFMENCENWRMIYEGQKPQDENLPGDWQLKLDSFDKILIMNCFRSDKVKEAIQNFIEKEKGRYFIQTPIVKLLECYEDSDKFTPIVFILSKGSDPKAEFDAFAESEGVTNIQNISLGQGQGEKAAVMISTAAQQGGWVLLQNCHLAATWMPELEAIVENLNDGIAKEFRLWLTSKPTIHFPIQILQNSVKITVEPPQGLRDNLMKSYNGLEDKDLESDVKQKEFKKLIYGLCFFHAVVNERKRFGPIGWNILYDFSSKDLEVCRIQLRHFIGKEGERINFKVIQTITADINYGGRVTDKIDKRLINSLIQIFVCESILSNNYDMVSTEGDASGTYMSPIAGTKLEYITSIEDLPLNAQPEVFGLHSNAAITNAKNETRNTLQTLLNIQPKSQGSGGVSRDDMIIETAKFLLNKTPDQFDIQAAKVKYSPEDYNESMNTVLIQELYRYNKLLGLMRRRLINLEKAILGEVVMSEKLGLLADSIYNQKVPTEWEYPIGFLSLKPINSWIEELNQRVNFLTKWINEGQPNAFWFSGFFFPQAFITGTKQNFARKNKTAIDRLNFNFMARQDIDGPTCLERPDLGVYVYGVYLEGARWDWKKRQLNQSRQKELFSSLPVLHLKPEVDRAMETPNIYKCPLYKVVSRQGKLETTGHSSNFVMFIELPIDSNDQHPWIRLGVAGFLSLRY